MPALLLIIAATCALIGCSLLALSLKRNWRLVSNSQISVRALKTVRLCGWAALCFSLIACVVKDGAGFAALSFPLLFALGSFLVAMMLSYRPSLFQPVIRAVETASKALSGTVRANAPD